MLYEKGGPGVDPRNTHTPGGPTHEDPLLSESSSLGNIQKKIPKLIIIKKTPKKFSGALCVGIFVCDSPKKGNSLKRGSGLWATPSTHFFTGPTQLDTRPNSATPQAQADCLPAPLAGTFWELFCVRENTMHFCRTEGKDKHAECPP